MVTRSRGVIAVVAMVVAGALGGCTSSSKDATPDEAEPNGVPVINASQAVEEYTQRQKAWTLPEGVVWLEGLGPTRDENGNVLEDQPVPVGEAADMADLYWLCAWRWAYLTALDAGDTAKADEAMATLLTFEQKSRLWSLAKDEITKASLGDPSEMRLYYEHQCDYLVFAE
jgi:hypothetical protein